MPIYPLQSELLTPGILDGLYVVEYIYDSKHYRVRMRVQPGVLMPITG